MMEPTSEAEINAILAAVQASGWQRREGSKVSQYVGKFFDRQRTSRKVVAKVVGNHGTYTVSFNAQNSPLIFSCSCYVGGGCHHCHALVETFKHSPETFVQIIPKARKQVRTLDDLADYLKTTTLDSLTTQLKEKGISQSALAQSIGMSSRHLTSIKSCEARHMYYNELGATKLAALWVLENIKAPTVKATKKAAKKKKSK